MLQKESDAAACGNAGAGIDLANSDLADVEALVSLLMVHSSHRPKREVIELWAHNSGEAISWLISKAKEAGAKVSDAGSAAQAELFAQADLNIKFITSVFGSKPYDTGEGMKALCKLAIKEGVEVFFDSPARQLVVNNGRVTGVIAEKNGEYIQYNAKKAVVIGTGDYQNDETMYCYYLSDMVNLERKKSGRTGDGHNMITWVGGHIENVGHTKMAHDFDSGPAAMCNMSFLRVKTNGQRFCDETIGMEYMNCYLLDKEDKGNYCQIFDSAYIKKAAYLSSTLPSIEDLKVFMPEEKVEGKGAVAELIDTYKADTLEELAKKLRIQAVATFVATVKQLVASRKDTDYGVPSEHLISIDKSPYYGIHRHVRLTEACSGVDVSRGDYQCLDVNGKPIPGLYAIGNTAGSFYGSIDYPLTVYGLNLGRNYTSGYVVGKRVAKM